MHVRKRVFRILVDYRKALNFLITDTLIGVLFARMITLVDTLVIGTTVGSRLTFYTTKEITLVCPIPNN